MPVLKWWSIIAMERKGSKFKMVEMVAGKLDRHIQTRFKRTNISAVCLAVVILSLSGVASFRLMTTNPMVEREFLEEQTERDPSEPFRLGPLVTDWDEQRAEWLEKQPHMRTTIKGKPRMFMITGSQTEECLNPIGDYWLLKAYKNKMDYCRRHHIESYYNMGVMDSAMVDFWVKLPLIRNIMLTHPEVEWVWWMDSDAMFTDMAFEIPLEKYADHNMVIHGWPHEVFEKKNWVGLNAGIFLVRNCQWTLDFLDLWGSLGENRGMQRWNMGKILTQSLQGRVDNFPADDQSSLIYLLNDMKDKLSPKIYLESDYYLHGYWVYLTDNYEENMRTSHPGFGDDRWPFITHFVGCKLCADNNDYPKAKCLQHMSRAFNFADNQVVEEFGLQHVSLESPILRRVKNSTSTAR
ncbi:unnamed protein product [Calypogeia fissa]